jgi:hypothetical protein
LIKVQLKLKTYIIQLTGYESNQKGNKVVSKKKKKQQKNIMIEEGWKYK